MGGEGSTPGQPHLRLAPADEGTAPSIASGSPCAGGQRRDSPPRGGGGVAMTTEPRRSEGHDSRARTDSGGHGNGAMTNRSRLGLISAVTGYFCRAPSRQFPVPLLARHRATGHGSGPVLAHRADTDSLSRHLVSGAERRQRRRSAGGPAVAQGPPGNGADRSGAAGPGGVDDQGTRAGQQGTARHRWGDEAGEGAPAP